MYFKHLNEWCQFKQLESHYSYPLSLPWSLWSLEHCRESWYRRKYGETHLNRESKDHLALFLQQYFLLLQSDYGTGRGKHFSYVQNCHKVDNELVKIDVGSCATETYPWDIGKCYFEKATYFVDVNYYCWVDVDCSIGLMEDWSHIK